jgi:hypothetical protein
MKEFPIIPIEGGYILVEDVEAKVGDFVKHKYVPIPLRVNAIKIEGDTNMYVFNNRDHLGHQKTSAKIISHTSIPSLQESGLPTFSIQSKVYTEQDMRIAFTAGQADKGNNWFGGDFNKFLLSINKVPTSAIVKINDRNFKPKVVNNQLIIKEIKY